MLQRSDISASHLMLRNTAGEMAVYCGQHERKPKRTLFVRKKKVPTCSPCVGVKRQTWFFCLKKTALLPLFKNNNKKTIVL